MKQLILILSLLLIITNIGLADVRENPEKYQGTTYIGNIFIEYDSIPDPIKDYSVYMFTNSVSSTWPHSKNGDRQYYLHEIGFEKRVSKKKYVEKSINNWEEYESSFIARFTYRGILSASIGFKNYSFSYKSGFKIGFYELLGVAKYEHYNHAYYFNIELGGFMGYEFQIGNIIIYPEIDFLASSMTKKYSIQLTVSIGPKIFD